MSDINFKLLYDNVNIPQVDLPENAGNSSLISNVIKAGTYSESLRSSVKNSLKPLPEPFHPIKESHRGE